MRVFRVVIISLALFFLLVYEVQAGPLRGALRELLKGQNQNIHSLRQATSEFFAAKDAGNSQAAMQAADKAKQLWQGLPSNVRSTIEQNHPGTSARLNNLQQEINLPFTATAAQGASSTV